MPQGQDEMHRMQQDAVRRVQEMQNRARQAVDHSRQGASDQGAKQERGTSRQEQSVAAAPPKPQGAQGIAPLDALMQNSERTLILILILLLSSEKADMELLLALMYLII